MPWFKVDDGFHGHPKVLDLSVAAVGIWTLAGSWCAKYLTDGHVTHRALGRLGGTIEHAFELVEAGLWIEADGGYQFKDWEDYQPLKVDVEAERVAAQERMKKVRAAKKGVRPNNDRTDAERSPEQQVKFGRSSEEVRVAPSQSQSQSQPDPSQSQGKEDVAEIRPDVSRLCNVLADLIEGNGAKRPNIGKGWHEAARLMLDIDKRPVGEALALIQWCQGDPFWRANILSMPKFREKYDQLKLQRAGKAEKETPADPYAGRKIIRGGKVVSGA